jgi:hypothetical protein
MATEFEFWRYPMKNILFLTLLLTILILGTVYAEAATLHVKPIASGAANGATWTDALGANFTPVRGNTYYIAEGSYGAKTFSVPKSGTTLIIIQKATIADHGSPIGWSDSLGDGQAIWNEWNFNNTGYITFNGVSRTSLSAGHGFRVGTVGSCFGSEMVTLGPSGGNPSDHLTFEYLELAGIGYGNDSCPQRGFYSNANGTPSNFTIRFAHMHGMYTPFVTRHTSDWLIEDSFIRDISSTPAAHSEVWSDDSSDNVIIRRNYIKNPEGTAVFAILNGGGSSPVNSNTASNWQIYGNVIYQQDYVVASGHNPGTAGLVYCANDNSNRNYCSGWLFFNNTIYGFNNGTQAARLFFENVSGVTQTIARNNLWINNGSGAQHNNVTLSHNWYRDTPHTPDASNEQAGSSDPFVSSTTGNFNLLAATTAGSTTNNPSGNTTDIKGVTRGADGTWDRGAMEFGGGGGGGDVTPPMAPINLRIQ